MSNPIVSIVVPVYRSMTVLPELVKQVEGAMAGSAYASSFELVLTNDCSPDGSWSVIEELAAKYPFVRGVSLRKNVGQHNATMAGLRFSRGEIVVIMDDDLQHPPSAILQLAERIERGADVCYTRYAERKHALWKQWGSRINDIAATWLMKKPKGLYLSSFKALNRDIVNAVLRYDGPYTYLDALIFATTNSIDSVEIKHQRRWEGESTYNFRRLFSLWLKMATGSSIYPLRAATVAGFALALLSLIVFILVIGERMLNPQVPPGWASVIATVLFIGGIQTFCIGVIGEYVGRIYTRVNNAPQFVVGKTTFKRADPTVRGSSAAEPNTES
ncbi:glycosyltransferase family 2 protein [Mesorhizobium sp. J428]|uniref:glycosyltransferase family 2 protein n=1 Tax=Mesorhizobium sp. J428 TaxID=2898440 RepID=UPI002150830F|nr:glycosyltransferase family 2 protein [Mesorhizobium sp. J428]